MSYNNGDQKMNKDKLKVFLTIFAIYEIIMICILAGDSCRDIFEYSFCRYDGFQYVVMCGFVPLGIMILVWWRKEILGFLGRIFGDSGTVKKR